MMLVGANNKHKPVKRQLFPEKLWDLVNKPASGIQWSPDGKRIEVERTQLEKFIGTKFRSRNFDSFIRQLHFYGFRKCGNSYHHDMFQRGKPDTLYSMKRKYSNLTSGSICRSPYSVGSIDSPIKLRSPPAPKSTPASRMLTVSDFETAPGPSAREPELRLPEIQCNRGQDSTSNNTRLSQSINHGVKSTDSKRAMIYSLEGNYDSRFLLNKPNKFRTINGYITDVERAGNCIVIAIPESVRLQIGEPSPRYLIIKRSQYGPATILTAHFVYHCFHQLVPSLSLANNDVIDSIVNDK